MSWIEETSFGSGGTMSSGEVVGINCTIEPGDWTKGWQERLTAGADNLWVQGRDKGRKLHPYTMNFAPVNWVWLKYLFAVADADDSGTKTHTFTQRNTILSYKLEWAKRHTTSLVYTMVGNFVKSATMSFQKSTGEGTEGYVNVSLNCIARNVTDGSSVTSLSNITKDPFMFRMFKLTLDGSEVIEVNSGEITFDTGIDENDSTYCSTTNDDLIGEPIPRTFRLSGRFNVNVKDSTYFDLWDAETPVSGTNTFLMDRDGTGNDQLLITFGDFYIINAIAGTNLDGVTNVDIIWSADSISSMVARDDITSY